MIFTRRNTVLLGTLLTTIGGLTADRMFPGTGLTGPRTAAAAAGAPEPGAALLNTPGGQAGLLSVAERLAALHPGPAAATDALRLPAAWERAVAAARVAAAHPGTPSADEPDAFAPQVSAVMTGGEQAGAKVNGAFVRVGEQVQGWTLVGVSARTATFERDGRRREAKLSAR